MRVICIFFLIIASCQVNNPALERKLTKAIPPNSDIIFKIHNVGKIQNKINALEWWKELQKIDFLNNKLSILQMLCEEYELNKIFENKNIYLSAVFLNEDALLFITSITEPQVQLNKLMSGVFNDNNTPKKYENIDINNLTIGPNNNDIFFAQYHDIFLLSFSSIAIEESIRQLKYGTDIFTLDPIKKLDQNLPKYSDLNILVKTQLLEKIIGHKNIFLNSNTWSWFDVELDQTSILLNGVTNRGSIKYLEDSQYSNAKKSTIEQILPRHITAFYSYQINTKSDLNKVINTINGGVHENIHHLSKEIWFPQEINIAYSNNEFMKKSYVACKPEDTNEALNYLNQYCENNQVTKYLNYQITPINKAKMKKNNWLNKLLENWQQFYYITIDDYIILSDSIKKIKSLINNIIADQTIGKNKSIQAINYKMGTKSHSSFYLDFKSHEKKWQKIFNSIVSKNIASKDYFFNSIMLLHGNKKFKNPTIWTTNLNAETNYKPQLVINHYTNNIEILTQDIENTIYLINNDGKTLWKRNIGNAIMGDIHQIDTYKNNKLQYLFNTKDSIYLMDRNGKYVKPFPLASKNNMSMPISLFDYDNNRNYRILAIMGNKLNMYNKKGEIVAGWELLKTQSDITNKPQHYQLFNKDYIIISEENGTTHFLNRKGQARTILKSKINRSKNPMYLMDGNSLMESKLITQNTAGNIIYVYFDGTIDTLQVQGLKKDDQYIVKNDYNIIIKENKLFFSSKKNKFEYTFKSPYLSKPQVFTDKNSLIIGVQQKTDNLIYLFNEKGELYETPFFGTTEFSLGKLDPSGTVNLLVGSHEGLIYNYKVN